MEELISTSKEIVFEGKSIGFVTVYRHPETMDTIFDIEAEPSWPGGLPYDYDSEEEAEEELIKSFLEFQNWAKIRVEELNKWSG